MGLGGVGGGSPDAVGKGELTSSLSHRIDERMLAPLEVERSEIFYLYLLHH